MPLPEKVLTEKPISSSQWRVINIVQEGNGHRSVKAYVMQDLVAVHEANHGAKKFAVTSVKLGWNLTRVTTFIDAIKIAKIILDHGKKGLMQDQQPEARSSFPRWMDVWCVAQRKAGKHLDPKPYMEKYS